MPILAIKIRDPIFYGLHKKKMNKLMNVSIITDRKNLDFYTTDGTIPQKNKSSVQVSE